MSIDRVVANMLCRLFGHIASNSQLDKRNYKHSITCRRCGTEIMFIDGSNQLYIKGKDLANYLTRGRSVKVTIIDSRS
jgi:hypothetical protein